MLIRSGGAGDAEAIAELHAASWRSAYAGIMPDDYLSGPLEADRAALWRERLTGAVTPGLFVAEDAATLLGFVYLVPTADGRVLLDNLHARPERRGNGIGGSLLERGLGWAAAEIPGRPVYLEVLRDNTAAISFYERRGGRRTDARIGQFEAGFELPEYEYTWDPAASA
ncbi:GNAT family N-acetyltransferase [Nocardia bhagyanarayanae]|uniref:Ribosomal protein S18 acetylase RimI-like enzyme n=1 Tax=Nocardia bhagyanarayanae TaxID=1215925 RepID=A0A543FES9_9NOCA|nr:GNAT family N-acetyltransferase [Nocardia bhagyanarayanae]TQM32373.1 ribosomal protein S18 acetylase RimI-like enzyme [Nocardia bhagyanarayanae]